MTSPHDHLSERELAAMTDQLDQMHHDQAMPAMKSALTEWVDALRDARRGVAGKASSRRTFLLGAAGLGAGGVVLAACGSSSHSSAPTSVPASAPPASGAPASSSSLTGDLAVAATAVSLENLGIYAYKAGLAAATAGKLGKVPPAVATFAKTAMSQHQDHAKAWNSALTAAGKPAVTATDPALTPTVNAKFGQVTNVMQLAQLALLIENVAAETYQNAIPALSAASSVSVAATIQPVEMQHTAILYYVLGQYPGIQGTMSNSYSSGNPLAFNPTGLARPVTDYKGS